jgi:hypothetical protein
MFTLIGSGNYLEIGRILTRPQTIISLQAFCASPNGKSSMFESVLLAFAALQTIVEIFHAHGGAVHSHSFLVFDILLQDGSWCTANR